LNWKKPVKGLQYIDSYEIKYKQCNTSNAISVGWPGAEGFSQQSELASNISAYENKFLVPK
jgi:hypothetical protein